MLRSRFSSPSLSFSLSFVSLITLYGCTIIISGRRSAQSEILQMQNSDRFRYRYRGIRNLYCPVELMLPTGTHTQTHALAEIPK